MKPDKLFLFSILSIAGVLVISGVLLALIINYMYGSFSLRLIKISVINTLALSGGVVITILIIEKLLRRIPRVFVFPLSLVIISGISILGFGYIFLLEPVFFLYGSSLVKSYMLINAVFAFTFTVMSSGFLIYQQVVLEKEKQLHEEKHLRSGMENRLYNAKINPHFLFNSLNLLLSLLNQPGQAEKAIIKLSDLLRQHLDAADNDRISLAREIKNVEDYLYIQKLRFEDRLTYEIQVTADGSVIPLLLQPLVENCIKHNLQSTGKLHISITASVSKQDIFISVIDSAKKLDPHMLGNGTGLSVTKKRVELAGGTFLIRDGGIQICLPSKKITGQVKK